MIRQFPFLKPGDLIGVAAPSARFDREKLDQGVASLIRLGFEVRVPELIYEKKRYLAGEDRFRAGVINELFADPDVKGIICARGGFGAMRMLDYLDWDQIRRHPKLVVGFSDVTALLTAIVQRCGFGTVHGPNLVSLADPDPETLSSFSRAVTGRPETMSVTHGTCLHPGQAAGRLAGGNMATLVHLIGTTYQPEFHEAVLFLEDVGEPAYKIDRMLSQMKMAGLFDRIAGVLFGSFEDCANAEYIPDIIRDILPDVPILMGMPSGHGRVNLSLQLGRPVLLDADRLQIQWRDLP